MSPPDCPTCAPDVVAFNNALPAWAAGLTTAQSPILLADVWTGFDVVADTFDREPGRAHLPGLHSRHIAFDPLVGIPGFGALSNFVEFHGVGTFSTIDGTYFSGLQSGNIFGGRLCDPMSPACDDGSSARGAVARG